VITLFGRPTHEWTLCAINLLETAGWEYDFISAESCTGREYNEQGIKTIPTLRIRIENNFFLNIEGIESIKRIIPANKKKECSFRVKIK